MSPSLDGLLSAQRALRSRWNDFRRALDRRDEAAYRFAITDFHENLRRWTQAQEKAILPALSRTSIPGRDPARELRLEYVQVRELARYLASQITERAPLADVLGLVENLERRLAAHESGLEQIYYPAAAERLLPEEQGILEEARPQA
jgi:hypothetical protein